MKAQETAIGKDIHGDGKPIGCKLGLGPALSFWAKIFPGFSPSKSKLSLSNLVRNLLETRSTTNGAWRTGDAWL